MPANVETYGDQASVVSLRVPMWHQLSEPITEELNPYEMLEAAHLANWNVRGLSLNDMLPEDVSTHMDKQVIVRDNPYYNASDPDSKPVNALGVVSGKYSIAQNEEMADFMELLGARMETAGSLFNGTLVFMTSALEREIVIDEQGANDVIKNYFMLSTGHDGTASFVGGMTPIRVICSNTMNLARQGMVPTIKIRHSKSIQDRIEDAKRAMNLEVEYTEAFAEMANELYQKPVNDKEFFKIIQAAYPEPDKDSSKAAQTRWDNKRTTLQSLWHGPTQENIQKSAWGALNALTEDFQWNRGTRNDNQEAKLAAGSGLDALANKERNRLLSVVSEFVGV